MRYSPFSLKSIWQATIAFVCAWMLLSLSIRTVQPAQTGGLTCEQFVTIALSSVGTACDTMDRNQVCYGNRLVDVEFRPNTEGRFDDVGDVVDLLGIQRLNTAPFASQALEWGVAVMKAQVNLPETLPGQNATFLLVGDAALENTDGAMTAIRLETGINELECDAAPPNALIVQGPGGQQITLNLNGADVTMGSTLYFSAEAGDELRIGTIEGIGVVSAFGFVRIVAAGSEVRLPLGEDDGLTVIGAPSEAVPYDADFVRRLPILLLPDDIERADPTGVDPLISTPSQTPTTPLVTTTPNADSSTCTVRSDWSFTYIVQAGDTLSDIAGRARISINDLAAGNCLTNINRIVAGASLRVPVAVPTRVPPSRTPTPTITPSATIPAAPTNPNLRADTNPVPYNTCTIVRWNVQNIREVYFENQPAVGDGSQQVCPTADTTYTLLVIAQDGSRTPYPITIRVLPPTTPVPICGNRICEPGESYNTCSLDCLG